MNNPRHAFPLTRREFLKRSAGGLGLIAFSGFAPSFITQSAMAKVPPAEKDRSILVLVQLAGGNDGLNTLVPYTDDHYYKLRPTLHLDKDALLILNDHAGLHPSCTNLAELWKEGELCIVQNVGYPNPNRSHFRSMEIWETATDSDVTGHTGWLGRYLDNCCSGTPENREPEAVHLGDQIPDSFLSNKPHSIFGIPNNGRTAASSGREATLLEKLVSAAPPSDDNGGFLQQMYMDALVTEKRVQSIIDRYKTDVEYPGNALARSLRRVAALIAGGMETRIYFVSQSGYDTHANQLGRHANLLRELSTALYAFQRDLKEKGLQDQVLTMTFSEFGRRPYENISQGTDHGTAAPLFILGSQLNSNFLGTPPVLDSEQRNDPEFSTDFRSVYATIIQKWFQSDPKAILNRDFPLLPFLS